MYRLDMKRTTRRLNAAMALAVLLSGVLALVSGCKKGVSAKEPTRIITRWKSEAAGKVTGSTFGLVIEKEGDKFTGRMFELKGREGFEILETYPPGRYDPISRELIIPIGQVLGGSLDDYLKAGMPYLKFQVILSRDRLVGMYHAPGLEPTSYTFLRYEPPIASAR